MNVVILLLTCLLAFVAAVEDKPEADLSTNVEVPPDQDVSEWNYRTYYGHYYNPYGYYGRGYWRGRRSVDEKKPEAAKAAPTSADQDVNEWHGRRYYGYPYGYPYRYHYGHWRGRRAATDDQKTEEYYYPGWGYNRGYYYGGYPYRQHSYYYGHHSPSSYSYSYRH